MIRPPAGPPPSPFEPHFAEGSRPSHRRPQLTDRSHPRLDSPPPGRRHRALHPGRRRRAGRRPLGQARRLRHRARRRPAWALAAVVALQLVWLVARSEAWHVCVGAAGGQVGRRRLYRAAAVGYLGNLFNSSFGLGCGSPRCAARPRPSARRLGVLIAAEMPIVVVEIALAALCSFTLVAPLNVAWWVPIICLAVRSPGSPADPDRPSPPRRLLGRARGDARPRQPQPDHRPGRVRGQRAGGAQLARPAWPRRRRLGLRRDGAADRRRRLRPAAGRPDASGSRRRSSSSAPTASRSPPPPERCSPRPVRSGPSASPPGRWSTASPNAAAGASRRRRPRWPRRRRSRSRRPRRPPTGRRTRRTRPRSPGSPPAPRRSARAVPSGSA